MQDRNNKKELEELILSSYESMYRMAFIYMKNESDAMDVVQDSVLKALRSAEQIKNTSYQKTWLFRIVINTALDELKRQKKTIPLEPDADIPDRTAGPDARSCGPDTAKALEILDSTEKEVILLRYCEEWKLEEIAIYMEKNLNTVKSILYRSLKKLKAELKKEDDL